MARGSGRLAPGVEGMIGAFGEVQAVDSDNTDDQLIHSCAFGGPDELDFRCRAAIVHYFERHVFCEMSGVLKAVLEPDKKTFRIKLMCAQRNRSVIRH